MSSTIRGPPRRTEATLLCLALMDFAERLVELRKERSLTQAALSKRVGIHISQIKRYEGGKAQPTLEIIRALSLALGATADELVFGKSGRGPDDDLRLQFEAISNFSTDEKKVVKALLEGLILKHEAHRVSALST